jgi:hypothetical protein
MKLFPEFKYNLKFDLTPEQFVKIMNNNMNIIVKKTNKVMGKSKLFTGINDVNFEMKHKIEGGNSGNPKITGIVKEDDNGCIVEIKFSLFSEVKAILTLMYLLALFFFLITFIIFIYELFHNRFILMFVGPIIFIIIIQIFIHISMDGQLTYVIEDIKEIVNSQKNDIS